MRKRRKHKFRIAFRVDGNSKIGLGHLFRCISLARYIRKKYKNVEIIFIMKDYHFAVKQVLKNNFKVKKIKVNKSRVGEFKCIIDSALKSKIKLLVFDLPTVHKKRHVQEINNYINEIKKLKTLTLSIGNTDFDVDVLINDTPPYISKQKKNIPQVYKGLDYLILDEIYNKFHGFKKISTPDVQHILISMGGADSENITLKVLNAIDDIEEDIKINVIIGPAFTINKKIKRRISEMKKIVNIIEKPNNLAKYFFKSDIAILTLGVCTYEAAALGIPTIVICPGHFHEKIAKIIEKYGWIINLGFYKNVKKDMIIESVRNLLYNRKLKNKMSKKGKETIDCKGSERVSKIIYELLNDKKM